VSVRHVISYNKKLTRTEQLKMVLVVMVSETACYTCDNIDVERSRRGSCPCVSRPHTSPYSIGHRWTRTWPSPPPLHMRINIHVIVRHWTVGH